MNTPRWYMLNKMGMATLCASKADAEKEAADAQRFWPHMGPHRAVQLVEAAPVAASAGSEPVAPEDYVPMLDDEGRMMIGASHHYTAENIRALVAEYKALEAGAPEALERCSNSDHRTRAGVLWRVIAALADGVPFTHPSPPEGMAGWKLVPVEPTEEMLAAAHDGDREYTLRNFGDVMTVMQGPYDHWAAMIDAAPPPPTTAAGSGKGE